MNFFGGPGRSGFGRGVFVPGHGPGGDHPLEWAIFALVLALLLLTMANLALAYAGRFPRGRKRGWRRGGSGGPGWSPPDPLRVLSVRYARGEIGRDEFLRATDDLRRGTPQPAPAPREEEAPTLEQPPEQSSEQPPAS